jgi:flagellar basal-body rod protein FlgG
MNVSLYQAAAALNANTQWQEIIAENLASSSIPGYKRQDVSFSAIEAGLLDTGAAPPAGPPPKVGMPSSQSVFNFASGPIKPTGVDTDVAIDGRGFFEVQLPNGDPAYTRDGEFHINAQGELVTKQGYLVAGETGPLQMNPANHGKLTIAASGEVSQGAESRGKLKLVDFSQPQLLSHLGGGYFQAREPSLQPQNATEATLRQRFLEGANTTPVTEMVHLLAAMRGYETNQRMIHLHDERVGQAIRDLAGTQ